MNKNELVDAVAERTGLARSDAARARAASMFTSATARTSNPLKSGASFR